MSRHKIGRYEILSTLGQGAMGVVYRANDPLLQRTVAIKTISLELSREEFEEFERRFYREASSAGRLNHPNIVTIHDVGNTDNVAYMAMEFLEGDELRDILDANSTLAPERVAEIIAQVADGLAFAHRNGVVHRDIKPSNIMILKNGGVKITDFGIALIPSSSRTVAGMILGSPKYMSPEQVIGQEVDGRADIFSLGVVLYEMLAGKAPFSGDNISALMYRILNEMPVPLRESRPELPEAFDYIVARALAKHPDERYQSASEMAEDLRHFLGLKVPDEFYAHSHDKPRTLERRAKPRNTGEQTVLMDKALAPERAETGRLPWQNRGMWLAAGFLVVVALAGAWWLTGQDQSVVPEPSSVAVAGDRQQNSVAESSLAQLSSPEPLPPEPQAAGPEVTLAFAVTPWGEVFVDGKREGVSPPLNELKLAPGKHAIEIRNPGFVPYTATIELQAGVSQKIKYKFK